MGAEAALSNSDLLPASRRPLPGDCGFQGCGPTSHPGHSFSRSSRVLTVHQAFCLALGTCGDQGPAGQEEGAGPAAQDPEAAPHSCLPLVSLLQTDCTVDPCTTRV